MCTDIHRSPFPLTLETLSMPALLSLPAYVFQWHSALRTIYIPSCSVIGSYAFQGCTSLEQISAPQCTRIFEYAFSNCTTLSYVSLPMCSSVDTTWFYNCVNLHTLYIPMVNVFYSPFSGCYRLLSLYIGGSSPGMMTSGALDNTPIGGNTTYTDGEYGKIYVPSALLSAYLSHSNWASLSSRIFGY